MYKKFIPFLLIVTLIAMMPFQVFAAKPEKDMNLRYLNLGDSIAYGLSAVDQTPPAPGYFELYAGYLGGNKFGLDENWPYQTAGGAVNLGIPGMDSDELLAALNGTVIINPATSQPIPFENLVASSDIITVSIGGNNLLTPVIENVKALFGIQPGVEVTVPQLVAMFTAAYGQAGGPEAYEAMLNVFKTSALSGPLGVELVTGSAQFVTEWPMILDRIYQLNPDVKVIALTLYNPVNYLEDQDLYMMYEQLIAPMNQALRQNQSNRCGLANVYDVFLAEPDAVRFNLSPIDFYPDPHPTIMGHQIISQALMESRNPNSFK